MSDVATPPVIGLYTVRFCSATGSTVKETDADDPLMLPVRVTGVDEDTDPTVKRNWFQAKPAGMVNVAGTGAAV